MRNRFVLSRRAMLRGLAGGTVATVALPVLEAMLDSNGEALAGGAPLPKRFVTFLFGNGVQLPRWTPAATGSGYVLTEQLAPLAPVKSYCSVLSGFRNKIPPITHHEGMAGMWSGHPYVETGGLESHFGGPSIDQVAADVLAPGTPFRSIEIGISKRVSENEGPTMQFLSHRAPDQPNPPQYNPRVLWNTLFNTAVAGDPTRPHRVSVLDAVAADAQRLKARLGSFDRDRLDAHLTSVSELQAQIGSFGACSPVAEPTEENQDIGGEEPMPAVTAAMTALLVHAFTCDLSRVASYMLTGGVGFSVYSHLGQTEEQHLMTHNEPAFREAINDGIVWNMQQFSNLLQALEGVQEGASNILANTVAVLGSDCSEGFTHGGFDMPVVIAGGGGGALVNPGIHFRASGTDRNLSDVLLTALQAVSPSITSVGSGVGLSTTPVTQILA